MNAPALAPVPRSVLIAALGGQGGGVLADWIAHAARSQGLQVQATSTPGVSQRTGATTYYLELGDPPPQGRAAPALGLAPVPGRVDVLVCAEWLEVARMLERGFCTPQRTTLVASTHRVYTTREKIDGGDGRYDSARIGEAARALSRSAVLFDMEAVRARHGAVISAALFGALAGSGALGLRRKACEDAIRDAGIGVARSLAAFDEAWSCATLPGVPGCAGAVFAGAKSTATELAGTSTATEAKATTATTATTAEIALPPPLLAQLATMPPGVAALARIGAQTTADYQDLAYAALYLDRVQRVAGAAGDLPEPAVAVEVARWLALWMCYDDLIRVAGLKARRSRLQRIREEAHAAPGTVMRVFDYFKPSVPEFAAVLPQRLGLRVERWAAGRAPSKTRGLTLQSSSLSGALLLRTLAALRRLRPRSLRYAREQQAIEAWLDLLLQAIDKPDAVVALDLAQAPRVLKGYGATHAAGNAEFQRRLHDCSERLAGRGAPRASATTAAKHPVVWLAPR